MPTMPESVLTHRIRFVVDGDPVTQGSMVSVQRGAKGAVRHQNAPRLYYWRDHVALAAQRKMKEEGYTIWDGPVGIRISFGIRPPKNDSHGYPRTFDLDKLVRAVLDALTGIVYWNDNRVVIIEAEKVFHTVTTVEVWRCERQSAKGTSAQATIW